ncbi:MAG TPA: EAL domain-containing protein [Acidiferrobacter sp.]|nr:EAL domain-containing protein [Acidiferrobacter sp.]
MKIFTRAGLSRVFGPSARRMLFVLSALYVITYASVSAIVLKDLSAYQLAAERKRLALLATGKLNLITREFFHQTLNDRAWAHLDVMNDLVTDDIDKRIVRTLRQMKTEYKLPGQIYAFNAAGTLVASSSKTKPLRGSLPRSWMPVQGHSHRFIDKSPNPYSGGMTVAFSQAIYRSYDPGRVGGYLVVTYPWAAVRALLRLNGGHLVLMSRRGRVLYNGTGIDLPPATLVQLRAHARRYSLGREAYLASYGSRSVQEFPLHWQIAAVNSVGAMQGYLHAAWRQIILWAFLLGAPMGALILWLAYRFTKPLADITAAVADISYSTDLTRRVEVTSRGELGVFQAAFNSMVSRVNELIAEKTREAEVLEVLAMTDSLTQLPNRALFINHLEQALPRAYWHKRAVAVLFLDLDRFKFVNDTLGHDTGDRLLRAASARLLTCVRETDTVARLGGDEFAILLDEVASLDDVAPIARKLLESLVPPFMIDNGELLISGSLGISLYPDDGTDILSLMKHADTAMYQAKQLGGNTYQFYQADMSAHSLQRFNMESDLRHALEREEFTLCYQPQVTMNGGHIVGVEALIRWRRPGAGLVSPAEFMPLLEETGLIIPVGAWVLETACRQHQSWRKAGLPAIRLAVNLSGRQFYQPDIVETVRRILKDTCMDSTNLELELTESVLMKDVDPAVEVLRSLTAIGVRCAIDDFGTGYSSLSYLKRFPINILKIDQAFVCNIPDDANDAAIVAAIITMAHALGIETVAEGVETHEQMTFLQARGCQLAQGYFFSRPRPSDEIEHMLDLRLL